MTLVYEQAARLQASTRRFADADRSLVTISHVAGEDPQLVARAEEYLAARRAHAILIAELEPGEG